MITKQRYGTAVPRLGSRLFAFALFGLLLVTLGNTSQAETPDSNGHPPRRRILRERDFSRMGIPQGVVRGGGNADAMGRRLRDQVGMTANEDLVPTRTRAGHSRFRQMYRNVPVFGSEVLVNETSTHQLISGDIISGLSVRDVDVQARISDEQALRTALEDLKGNAVVPLTFQVQTRELTLLPLAGNVFLTWHLVILVENHGPERKPGRWNYFVDAARGAIVKRFNAMDSLSQASGPSGNAIYTHAWVDQLDVEPISAGSATYKMDTARLQTINLNGSTTSGSIVTGPLNAIGTAAINDAHGYGEVTLNMLSDWFGFNSIDGNGFKLVSYVNYSSNYANAFWNGTQMVYGDGGSVFYPLSGGLDVVAHEINHGFTEHHSALIYDDESGGMNESFSDIAGTTAEFFLNPADANFDLGEKIVRPAFGHTALRYMCDPTTDGHSIGDFAQYNNALDVHYSSGLMNQAFCRMARRFSANGDPTGTATAAGVKRAATVFYEANAHYWPTGSTFLQGCQGTVDAATALAFSAQEVEWVSKSWNDSGVYCNNSFSLETNPVAFLNTDASYAQSVQVTRLNGFTGALTFSVIGLPSGVTATFSPAPGTADDTVLTLAASASAPHGEYNLRVVGTSGTLRGAASVKLAVVSPLVSGQPVSELSGNSQSWKYFRITVPPQSAVLTLNISGGTGDADLFVKRGGLPSGLDNTCSPELTGNNEQCQITNPQSGDWYVGIYAYQAYAGVTVLGTVAPAAPVAPSGLTAVTTLTQASLSWSDQSSNETTFRIERKVGVAGTYAEVGSVLANVTTFVNSPLTTNIAYYYRVRASNAGGFSAYSNEVFAPTQTTPIAPTNLTAVLRAGPVVHLTWVDASANETGFKIERKIGTGAFTAVATVAAGTIAYDAPVAAGNLYTFRVKATNIAGDSSASNEASASTVLPIAPSGLTATLVTTGQIRLNWIDASNNEVGFKIERRTSATATYSQVAVVGPGVVTFANTGLVANTRYYYRVRAYSVVGNSAYSPVATAITKFPPAAPTTLAVALVGTNGARLTWRDAAATEVGVKIERKIGATGTYSQVAIAGANAVTYTLSNLPHNTQVYFRIRSYNAGGNSAYTAEVSLQTH